MKIVSLNHETNDVEVFYLTDEYAKWCIDHAIGDEEYEEPERFNNFMTDFFRDLGYDNPEFKSFMRIDDDGTPVNILEAYPDEHVIETI